MKITEFHEQEWFFSIVDGLGPLSGVRAVLQPSSRAGVLTVVRRVRSAKTKQSGGCAYHGQPRVQCYNEAVEQVCLPWSGVRAVF